LNAPRAPLKTCKHKPDLPNPCPMGALQDVQRPKGALQDTNHGFFYRLGVPPAPRWRSRGGRGARGVGACQPSQRKEKVTYRAAWDPSPKTLPGVAGVDESLAEGVRPSKAAWPAPGRPPGPGGGRAGGLAQPGRLGTGGWVRGRPSSFGADFPEVKNTAAAPTSQTTPTKTDHKPHDAQTTPRPAATATAATPSDTRSQQTKATAPQPATDQNPQADAQQTAPTNDSCPHR
jgi:hypothetical protein